MNVPINLPATAGAAVSIAAAEPGRRPGRLVELHLVDLPCAATAEQEGQRDLPTDRQQLGRPDNGHPVGSKY
jgi:hypothetical protein